MYRNSAQINCLPTNTPPSSAKASDSDSDIIDALDRKRKQLDDEIANFKTAKDREFREFERELWIQKKRTCAGANGVSELTPTKSPGPPSSTASVLNLLASAQNGSANGWVPGHKPKRGSADTATVGEKFIKPAPLSKPTLSLDKLTIVGETTPSLKSLGTLPATNRATIARSPSSNSTVVTTSPRSQSERPQAPSTPTRLDRSDPFTGVFTPAYLPLLESRDQKTPQPQSPRPMLTTDDEERKRLQLDAESKQEAQKQLEQQLRSTQSLPPQPVSPTIVSSKRTKSASILPSASLPSALKTASGGGRKRKHVMFQLADLKVVEPSSSYEEGPSPDMEQFSEDVTVDGQTENNDGTKQQLYPDSATTEHQRQQTEGTRTNGSERLRPHGEKKNSKRRGRGGRFVSPMPSPLPSPAPSPIMESTASPPPSPSPLPGQPSSPHVISSPDESGFSGGLLGAEDGGSGVGFFELDEELASPALRDGKPAEGFNLELDDDLNEKLQDGRNPATAIPQVQVGSVPIDIIRPSSSWVGSFGH